MGFWRPIKRLGSSSQHDEQRFEGFKRPYGLRPGERLNARTALLVLFVALTIVLASTTVYESGIRTTLTSTSTSTSTTTSTATVVSTTTSTSFVDPTKALIDAYLSHINAIASGNATALAVQYEANATLYTAIPGYPPIGNFHGVANITGYYQEEPTNICMACLELKTPFAVANETRSISMSSDDKAGNVTSLLVFYGNTSLEAGCYFPNIGPCAALTFILGFDISYVLQGDRWLISTESLSYINSGQCLTISLSPDGGVLTCHGYSG